MRSDRTYKGSEVYYCTSDKDLGDVGLLGHALAIRVSVAGRGMSRVEMHLHPRVRGENLGLGRSHPGLDEMLANFRKYNPDVEKPAADDEVSHG